MTIPELLAIHCDLWMAYYCNAERQLGNRLCLPRCRNLRRSTHSRSKYGAR